MKKFIFLSSIVIICVCVLTAFSTNNITSGEHGIKLPETLNPDIVYPTYGIPITTEDIPVTTEETFDFKLTFVGDVMLAGDTFNTYTNPNHANYKSADYFLSNVKDIFSQDDYTIVNLENVLTDNNLSPIAKSGRAFWFKGPTKHTEILTSSSVEVVSLANNHTNDYGTQGNIDTVNAVTDAGLYAGDNDTIVYLNKNGFTIALICHGMWSESQADTIIEKIHIAEQYSDYQIVFYHGGTESIHKPESWKVRASRKLVDNGADLVIGNHPHVLQPMEEYNGATIIYSLGNFCFGGNRKPENRTIIYQFNLNITKENDTFKINGYTESIIPYYVYTGSINNYQPEIITVEEEKQKVIDFMNWSRDLPY